MKNRVTPTKQAISAILPQLVSTLLFMAMGLFIGPVALWFGDRVAVRSEIYHDWQVAAVLTLFSACALAYFYFRSCTHPCEFQKVLSTGWIHAFMIGTGLLLLQHVGPLDTFLRCMLIASFGVSLLLIAGVHYVILLILALRPPKQPQLLALPPHVESPQ